MATTNKISFKKVMTPKARFVFPTLDKPDTKFKESGEYKVTVELTGAEVETLREAYNEVLEAHVEATKADLQAQLEEATTGAKKASIKKQIADLKVLDMPIKDAVDDEGEPTGNYLITFKCPASYISKKTNTKVSLQPAVFDSKNNKMVKVPQMWTGTIGKVSAELRPFFTQVGCGISLRLLAVQVIELVNGTTSGGGSGGNSYGFGQEEGYESSEEEAQEDAQDESFDESSWSSKAAAKATSKKLTEDF